MRTIILLAAILGIANCATAQIPNPPLSKDRKFWLDEGWLNIGLYGEQPGLADFYITTGSLYTPMNIFLPLGLPYSDEFWGTPALPWTSVKIWNGTDTEAEADHAMDTNKS
ncbi:DUF2264 domain-containing protein [Mucilaginibacter boryungensis]|uniref:DUF2264 domain-containing protein n=1 Tax=Mucilaginibacter boryungensis TaxID=768480 RepID=A0ABR9XEB1_9SPHI|nr:DUF2264 domain-containing protein [Mucilaginibacter boryungensis]MBE9665723.1 DUF2264 domain-containing protein [Mucilaginibacter boryungensis]